MTSGHCASWGIPMSEPDKGKGPVDLFPGERPAMGGRAWGWRTRGGIAMDGFNILIHCVNDLVWVNK